MSVRGELFTKTVEFWNNIHCAATRKERSGMGYDDTERSPRSIPKLKTQTARDWVSYNPFYMHCNRCLCVCLCVDIEMEMNIDMDTDVDINIHMKSYE